MSITIGGILEKLIHYNPEIRLFRNESIIKQVRLLRNSELDFNNEALYIGHISDLPQEVAETANILCVSEENISNKDLNNTGYNLIVLKTEDINIPRIFNEIQDILLKRQAEKDASLELLDCITNGSGIQNIIKIGYKLMGNPMCIIDTRFRLLSFTRDTGEYGSNYAKTRSEGYFTYETVSYFKKERINEKIFRSTRPVVIKSQAFGKRIIVSNIIMYNRIVAYLIIVELERSFNKEDINLVELLSGVLSSEIQKDRFIRNITGDSYEYFISDLLDGKIKGGKVVRDKIKSLDWDSGDRFNVITISIREQDSTRTPIFYIRDVLGNMFSRSRCIAYDNNIVIVVSSGRDKALFGEEMKFLQSFLEDNKMYCAVSRRFSNLADIRSHYLQTLKCLELGKRIDADKVIFKYEDYVTHHIIDSCLPQVNLLEFCHPLLLELMEYDKNNNARYTQSLYSYILNDKKLIETANSLHIHRNTMSYRIDRIKKMLEIDLDDSNLVFQFLVSFKILEYVNEASLTEIFSR